MNRLTQSYESMNIAQKLRRAGVAPIAAALILAGCSKQPTPEAQAGNTAGTAEQANHINHWGA